MSRSTQYIGLCDYAWNWLENATILSHESYRMTEGMFGEEIVGKIWYIQQDDQVLLVKEMVQAVPLSSGPMIFTHLHVSYKQEEWENSDAGFWFSWMLDPTVEEQFDAKTGRYYL